MCGTGGFAGSGALVIAVFAVIVAVIRIPVLFAPLKAVGEFMLRVFDGIAVLVAKLLAKLYCARWTVFHTFAAGDALCAVNLGRVGAAGEIRRVE